MYMSLYDLLFLPVVLDELSCHSRMILLLLTVDETLPTSVQGYLSTINIMIFVCTTVLEKESYIL